MNELEVGKTDSTLVKIVEALAGKDYDETAWLLGIPITTLLRNITATTVKKNVNALGSYGLETTITRTSLWSCCDWCAERSGTYSYPVSDEIYKQHNNCTCVIIYNDPIRGYSQNVRTKVSYNQDDTTAALKSMAESLKDQRTTTINKKTGKKTRSSEINTSTKRGAAVDAFVESITNAGT